MDNLTNIALAFDPNAKNVKRSRVRKSSMLGYPMKNTLPNVPVHAGTFFTWKREGVGIADASDLTVYNKAPWARLFADSADVGFYVVSHKTGVKKLFILVQTIKQGTEDDTEIIGWSFFSDDHAVRLTVFND